HYSSPGVSHLPSAHVISRRRPSWGRITKHRFSIGLVAGALLGGCGDDVGLSHPQFSVSGTVAGLSGAGLGLQLNGGTGLAIVADGGFKFPTPVTSGAVFGVTILSQPASGSCTVLNGGGTMPRADVTNVSVTCSVLSGFSIAGLADPLALQQWHL